MTAPPQGAGFDPGLTQRYTGELRRIINRDGSFNVRRRSGQYHLYLHLISMSWPRFFLLALCSFIVVSGLFADVYVLMGPDNLAGADAGLSTIANAFFFSTQTLTTVGYGHIAPKGLWTSMVAALEGMTGVMGFAVLTGVLFGRVSRPSARIVFSDRMVVAPYGDGTSLQFRIANSRPNILMDLSAVVLLMTVEKDSTTDQLKRTYRELALERQNVYFFPLTWTVVHPITPDSPLWQKTAEDLKDAQAEALILIRFFDDTFSQNVNARYSYRHEEITWNARFEPAFHFDHHGDMILDIAKIHNVSPA